MSDAYEEIKPSPWARPPFIISTVVVAAIVVVGIVLALTGRDANQPIAQPTDAATPSSTAQTRTPTGGASVCGLKAGDQTVPTSAPRVDKWELVGTVAAPTLPAAFGPGVIDPSGFRYCYAHSPTGVLFAAANFVAMTSSAEIRLLAGERATARGNGRDLLVEAMRNAGTSANSTSGTQVAGFTVRTYRPDEAVVDLAAGAIGAQGYARLVMTFAWEDGDWKFRVPADGTLDTIIQPIPDLTGYIPWGGA